ncbi:MAG: Rieske 2Fe-2S domain-containing protein [Parvibaculum sp.]|uniref:Rieske 2Fe-2S domain-containing protein n=1 Tax=Parvibaculum sp. TaxID=2024848 RepID=UPI0025CB9994|nr:Rieske 2Fe-2S domain-containing protein [Parvibaculum sp.]MCE9649162.1 Rieske 2Fe-2S domain-containing protein [Parvibaculum sp.]
MAARQRNATDINPNGLPMRIAATYSREIEASRARAWENVRDWEHLPWLHAGSFSECRLDEEGEWGWRAVTRGTGKAAAQQSVIEVAIDAALGRYVSRTLEGPLPGVEIWTQLTELAPRRTRVEVEFHLPHLSEELAQKAGEGLVRLYTRLWNEDEAMMIARQAALDERRNPAMQKSLTCPHMGAPLDHVEPDAQGCITCPWHGYRFDAKTGLSADGRGLKISLP